jgi:hypothetical protein
MRTLFALVAIGAVMASGCGGSGSAQDDVVTVALGQTVSLTEGRSVRIPEEDVTVRFDAVVEDSRCPINATCVTAGRAVVRVVVGNAGTATPLTGEVGSSVTKAPYSVRLVALDPLPVAPVPNPAPAKTLTLEIFRIRILP